MIKYCKNIQWLICLEKVQSASHWTKTITNTESGKKSDDGKYESTK